MAFWNDPRVREAVKKVVIAVLVALLGILGYERVMARRKE